MSVNQGVFTPKQDLFKYLLPSGIPRNSLVIIAGEGGSGKSVIVAHLVKDAVLSEEPVVYVAIDDDPQTILNQLNTFGVKTLEECNSKRLVIIDGFSYLMQFKKPQPCVEEEILLDSPGKLINSISRVVDKYKIADKGLVVVDSLNDIVMLLDPTRVVEFIKSLRANFAKARGVLTIATLHTSTTSFKEYLLSIEHLVDGVIETGSIPEELAQHIPIFVRQIVVRKMKGVDSKQGPVLYGIDREGLKPVILKISGSTK